jgi:hypothetical protein
MMARLALSALVAGAVAGMLLPVAFFLGGLALGGWGADRESFARLIEALQIGLLAGSVLATLPALFAGAALWALGESFDSARRPPAWAAAGAAVTGALWLLLQFLDGGGLGHPDFLEMSVLAAGLPAGAGGALAFLGAMRLSGALLGDPRQGPA